MATADTIYQVVTAREDFHILSKELVCPGNILTTLIISHKNADYPLSTSNTGASQSDSEEKPQAQMLPAFFHLECTNFVAKSTVGVLSLSMLQDAFVKTLEQINVDIVEFVASHSMVSD